MPTENQWLVFVYGTLKQGCSNWDRLLRDREGVEFVGEAISADPAYLMQNGGFPLLAEHPEGVGHFVRGELFRVTDSVRAELDRLEGHPSFYERKLRGFQLLAPNGGSAVQAWVYLNPFRPDFVTNCKEPTGGGEPRALVWHPHRRPTKYGCTLAMLRHFPQSWWAWTSSHLVEQVKEKYPQYKLEAEDYTDEVHVFYRDGKGKRRRFCNLQVEG